MKKSQRRRIIRLLGWLIGVFASVTAVLLLLAAAYLLFADYPEQLRAALERQLSEVSGTPATVRSINLDLPHYSFVLQGIEVGVPERAEPVLELERVRGKLRLGALLTLRVIWDELIFDGLTLHLEEDPAEGLVFPGSGIERAPVGELALAAERISIERGFFVIANERVPWQLDASNLELDLSRRGTGAYQGSLRYEAGQLRVKDHEPVEASLNAEFEIVARELFVREALATSEVAELEFTGKLGFADGARGRFALSAAGDAGIVAESLFGVAGASRWLEGRSSFRGSLAVEPDNKVLQGTVVLPRGRLAGLPVSDWSGEVFWDHSLMQVSYARGAVAGGVARLQFHQPLPQSEHAAALEWEIDGASLAGILEESTGRPSPLSALVSGKGSYSSSVERLGGGETRFELRGAPGTAVDSEAVPLTFSARGRAESGNVEIEDARFDCGLVRGSLSGLYPLDGTARFAVDVESSDLAATDRLQREIRSLLRRAESSESPEPALWNVSGRGEVRGALVMNGGDLRFDGDVSAPELRFRSLRLGELRARAVATAEEVRLDDLAARLDDGALAGRGVYLFSSDLLELDVILSRWPLEEIARAFGSPVEMKGALSGRIATGPVEGDAEGAASLELGDASIAGIPFDRGEARLTLHGDRLRLDPLSLTHGQASLSGRIEADLRSREIAGLLETKDFPLEGMPPAWAKLSGAIEATVELSGRIEAPAATLSGRGRGVSLRGIELGEAFLSGNLGGGELDLSVTVEREAAELALEASAHLEGDVPTRGRLRWHGLDVGPWMGLGPKATAVTDGSAELRFAARARDALERAEADIELDELALEGESYRIESTAPVTLRLRGGKLELSRSELSEGATSLFVSGLVDLGTDSIDIEIDGSLGLGALETLYPGLRLQATGEASVSARVVGSREEPAIAGYAELLGASVRFEGFRQALGDLRGRIVFDNRTLRIPELRGVFGSGPVEISGSLGLDGLPPGAVDVVVRGADVRLRYPDGFVATIQGELNLLGSENERMLSGALVLDDALWTREYDLVSGILTEREGLALFHDLAENELFQNVRLDVKIRAPESFRIRNSLAVIEATAELELRGTVSEPVLLGRSEAQRGELYFLGQRYNVTSGKVDFVDPSRIEPFVDLTAETRVRSYRVELRLTGTPDRVHPELTSDPPLRTVDILRLLAGANERDIFIGNEEEELAGVGVASLLTERLTQEVGKRAERLFGLDRFSINPSLLGQFANPTARVSVGKQITRELTINYSTNLNATTEAIILIEYTPEGPMSWILSRDEEGDIGIDVKFRRSF